jgi:hypothetical protein
MERERGEAARNAERLVAGEKEKSPMRFTSRGSSVGDDLLSRGAVSSAEKA